VSDRRTGDRRKVDAEILSFADVLYRLHAEKHTGPVTIHFHQGQPQSIEIPAEPTRITLDKAEVTAA
jgi:hypothetical protein